MVYEVLITMASLHDGRIHLPRITHLASAYHRERTSHARDGRACAPPALAPERRPRSPSCALAPRAAPVYQLVLCSVRLVDSSRPNPLVPGAGGQACVTYNGPHTRHERTARQVAHNFTRTGPLRIRNPQSEFGGGGVWGAGRRGEPGCVWGQLRPTVSQCH